MARMSSVFILSFLFFRIFGSFSINFDLLGFRLDGFSYSLSEASRSQSSSSIYMLSYPEYSLTLDLSLNVL
jgi:hypothetical protein